MNDTEEPKMFKSDKYLLVFLIGGGLLVLALLVLTSLGCCVTAYHHDHYDPEGKVTSKIEVWQGQLLHPSKYKGLDLRLPDESVVRVAESYRWPDPEAIEAAGSAGGKIIGEAIKKAGGK